MDSASQEDSAQSKWPCNVMHNAAMGTHVAPALVAIMNNNHNYEIAIITRRTKWVEHN